MNCAINRCPNNRSGLTVLCESHLSEWFLSSEYRREKTLKISDPNFKNCLTDFIWITQRHELKQRGQVMTKKEVWDKVKAGEINPVSVE